MCMSQLKLCLITPSYKPDFARCRLLVQSCDRFIREPIHHYIVVDRRDYKLFQQLKGKNRTIITVESILPPWIQKFLGIPNGWFSFKTLPIRNWLIQQIVKLEIVNHLQEDILIFVDSDVAFIRPFSFQQFIKKDKVRLFRASFAPSSLSNFKTQIKWCHTATTLLGLPPLPTFNRENPFVSYVGNLITWRRDNILQLHQHIERVTQKSWLEAIANSWNFSEYMLYGIFVERILKDRSGHYCDLQPVTHEYWGTKPLTKEQLQQFWQNITPECFAVMISAKSKTPIDAYVSFIKTANNLE